MATPSNSCIVRMSGSPRFLHQVLALLAKDLKTAWRTRTMLTAMVVFGIGRGMYDCNCMPALCQIARDDLRSTGFGLFNFIGPFAGGIVAAAAGALKSTLGIGGALQVAGALLLLSAALLTRIKLPETTGVGSTM